MPVFLLACISTGRWAPWGAPDNPRKGKKFKKKRKGKREREREERWFLSSVEIVGVFHALVSLKELQRANSGPSTLLILPPIHESDEHLLYLALCWRNYFYISAGHLILEIDTLIVYWIRCIVYYQANEWMWTPILGHCIFTSGTLDNGLVELIKI